MINSFWNICSTCPMPREEKLNSEYKRNYVWHPQYKPLAQDVISCAPQPGIKEIGIQRRKQYPELAYRSNEVIRHDLGHHSKDAADLRARSEERDAGLASKSGPRSRSAEPGMSHQQQKLIMIQSFPPVTSGRVSMLPKTEEFPNILEQPSETTEYKEKFAWPRKTDEEIQCMARKSVSMGIIKSSDEADISVPKTKIAPVHRPCVKQKEAANLEKTAPDSKRKVKTEYKAKYKPFTSYVYVDGQWKKTSRLVKIPEKQTKTQEEPWFVEVVERLQKANEYRWRGHGHPVYGEILPEMYKPDISTQRSKIVPPELLINQPKCHQPPSKKSDSKKKEVHIESAVEKKKETKPSVLRRPKSAEPAKTKEPVKHKRPVTTPPAKQSSHVFSARRRIPKDEDLDKKTRTKPAVAKKQKEDTPKPPHSANRKTHGPASSSQSSGGKVWLQAGQSLSEPKAGEDSSVREHSDAVRPSSLSPISINAVPQPDSTKKLPEDVEEIESKEQPLETKSAVPQSSVVPLTHVRTPEEVTGVKSPDPENWTVPIENSEKLQWSGVSTSDVPAKTLATEEAGEKLPNVTATDEPVPSLSASQEASHVPSSSKLTSTNVLDRARSRLDQFWGKNK